MSIEALVKTVVNGAKKHKPEIMVGVGIAAGVGAVIVAVKETPACVVAFEEAKEERKVVVEVTENGDEVVKSIKLDWETRLWIIAKYFWPVVLLEGASIFFIVYGTKIRFDGYTTLAALYGITKAERDDLKKVIAAQPANWQKKFAEAKAESHINETKPEDVPEKKMSSTEVPMPLQLLWDDQARVYFRMSEEDLRDAVAEFTHMINTDPFNTTTMNDWMDIIGHEHVINGDYYIFSMEDTTSEGALKYNQIGVKESPTGEPARMMKFSWEYHLDTRGMFSEV